MPHRYTFWYSPVFMLCENQTVSRNNWQFCAIFHSFHFSFKINIREKEGKKPSHKQVSFPLTSAMLVVYQHNGSIDNLKQLSNILLKAINFSTKIYLFCAFVEPFSCHCNGPVKLSRGLISFQWALSLRVHLGHPQDLWYLIPRSDWTARPRESWQVLSNTESPELHS